MKDFGIFLFALLAGIGICFVLGILFRGTDKDEEHRDEVMTTFLRGLGISIAIFTGLSILIGIIYLISLPFQ